MSSLSCPALFTNKLISRSIKLITNIPQKYPSVRQKYLKKKADTIVEQGHVQL